MKTTKKENMKLLTTLYEIGFNHYNNLSLTLSLCWSLSAFLRGAAMLINAVSS